MATDTDTRSPLAKFFDSFFQERNIKWLLGIGIVILLGSSLTLVASHWDDYTRIWQYFIFLAYTAALFVLGEIGYTYLDLKRTGTSLKILTVLLLPLTFIAVRWVNLDSDELFGRLNLTGLGLFILNTVFACFAAGRIFRHFLRRTQPTFVICYLILCLAGTIVPLISNQWAALIALTLWSVFAIGTIKVNRHVFWLTEAHQLPRVFGFFPIALLGAQFLTIFALGLARHVDVQWIGLGAVLVSIPVLMTSDAVAAVFQQRTGNLVRQLPWSVGLPFIVGLVLCASGVCLSATGFPSPYALVPSAALMATMMALVARRTKKSAFVWAGLAGIVIAYQFCPVFFIELAKELVKSGASAVNEDRLPYPFYGLTYLPLILAAMISAFILDRKGLVLFAHPIRRFAIGLSILLTAISLWDAKAVFPVSLAMTAVFCVQSMLYRDRRLILPAVATVLSTGFGFSSFATGVLDWQVTDLRLISLACCAIGLLFVGLFVDRVQFRKRLSPVLQPDSSLNAFPICQASSFVTAIGLTAFWIAQHGFNWSNPIGTWSGGLVGIVLFCHCLRWKRQGLGEAAIVFAVWYLLRSLYVFGLVPFEYMLSATAVTLLAVWCAANVLGRFKSLRLSIAIEKPGHHVGVCGLSALLLLVYVPHFFVTTFNFGSTIYSGFQFSWVLALLTIGWAFLASRRSPLLGLLAVLGCLGTLGLISSVTVLLAGLSWVPVAWATAALAGLTIVNQLRDWRGLPRRNLIRDAATATGLSLSTETAVTLVAIVLLTAISALTLLSFTWAFRIANIVAVIGLLVQSRFQTERVLKCFATLFFNWSILSIAILLFCPEIDSILNWQWFQFASGALPMAMIAAISLLLWTWSSRDTHVQTINDLVHLHIVLLRFVIVISLFSSLQLLDSLSLAESIMAIVAFAALAGSEFLIACLGQSRQSGEDRVLSSVNHVWIGQALIAAGVAYLVIFRFIQFGRGLSMYLILATAFCCWGLGRLSARSKTTLVLARPLILTGTFLPLVSVVVGVGGHVMASFSMFAVVPTWLGANSLALLLAAGFYYWLGMQRRRTPFLILSATILNIAFALLCHELHLANPDQYWSDPQLFMIPIGISILWLAELLNAEIPVAALDPLRYIGALVILVSPTFYIVGGSWVHLLSLMILSVGVTLVSIGLRLRPLMYAGVGFLIADLIAMIVVGSIENLNILWIAGIALGTSVIALAAYCEKHRELVLQRLRILAAELETWDRGSRNRS